MEYYSEFFPPRSDAGTRGTTVPILPTADLEALKDFVKGVADDNVITVDEKIRGLIPLVDQFRVRYDIVLAKATQLGVEDETPMENLTSKFDAWEAFLVTLTEPTLWSNTEGNTDVDRETFNTRLSELVAAFTSAEAANIPSKAGQIYYDDPNNPGTKIPVQDLKPAEGGATNSGNPNSPFGNTGKTIGQVIGQLGQTVIIDTDAPAIPTGLAMSSTVALDSDNTQIVTLKVVWSAVTASDLAGYVLELRESSGSPIEYTLGPTALNYDRPVRANTLYYARVKTFDKQGNFSNYSAQVSHTTGKDTVPPGIPTNVTVESGLTQNFIRWSNPLDSDLARVEIVESTTATPGSGGTIGFIDAVPGSAGGFARTVPTGMDLWYSIRAIDTSGNASGLTTPVKATSRLVVLSDFTPGLQPVGRGTSLPNPVGYTGPKTFFNESDGKTYNYVNGAWQTGVSASDIAGTLLPSQLNINIGGGNLVRNSSMEGAIYGGPYGQNPAGFGFYTNDGNKGEVSSIVAGRTGGNAYRVSWTGNNSQKGFILLNGGGVNNYQIWKVGITYIFSFYARADGAAVGQPLQNEWNYPPQELTVIQSPPLSTNWQRYIFKFKWTAEPVEYYGYASVPGGTANGVASIDFDDVQIEEGNIVTAYAPALLPGEITANLIAPGAVGAAAILDGAIPNEKIGSIAAPKVTGQLTNTQIADLAATKVTGQLTDSQVSALSAAKISGQLLDTQLAALSASKITGQIVGVQIGDNAISAPKISANAINATHIQALAITGDKIAANTITTRSMVITGGGYLNADPMMADATSWAMIGASFLAPPDIPAGKNAIRSNTGVSAVVADQYFYPIDTTKRYRFRFWARNTADANGVLYADLRQFVTPSEGGAGPYNGGRQPYKLGAAVPGTAYVEYTSEWGPEDFQPGVRYVQPDWLLNYQGTAGWMEIANPRLEEMVSAQLIVNGAIIADKIASSAITTEKLAVGSVVAEKIAAGAILTSKLTVSARPFALDGVTFSTNASENRLYWTAGTATYTSDAGSPIPTGIQANSLGIPAGSTYYIYYVPGRTYFDYSTELVSRDSHILIGTYRGGHDWFPEYGATIIDGSKIATGSIDALRIKANAITADKLTINNRGISIQGLDFQYNRSEGNLYWTAGLIFYVNDAGAPTYANIPAGGTVPVFGNGGIRYIWWQKGTTALGASVDNWPDLVSGDYIILATWTGGTNFVANYGGTIVDGDRITTGSVNANRIIAGTISSNLIGANEIKAINIDAEAVTTNKIAAYAINAAKIAASAVTANAIAAGAVIADKIAANQITGDKLVVGTISAAYLAVGAVTAEKLAIGTRGANLAPIPGPDGWRIDPQYGAASISYTNTASPKGGPTVIANSNGTNAASIQTIGLRVTGGRTYLLRYWIHTAVSRAGHYTQLWTSDTPPAGAYFTYDGRPYMTPVTNMYVAANTWTQVTREVTIPNNISYVSLNFYMEGPSLTTHYGDIEFYEQQISATIADGAITTPKMVAGSINADRLIAGSILATQIGANVITADKLSVGTIQRTVNNLLDENIWKQSTSFAVANPLGSWNDGAANQWANVQGPSGGMDLAILLTAQAPATAGGGWDFNFTPAMGFSPAKSYRHYTWVKRFGTTGSVYLGTQNARYVDGTPNGNPYHISHSVNALPEADKWYLMVGIVHGQSYTGADTNISGIYDPRSGRKVVEAGDFKWNPDAPHGNTRAYQYYSDAGSQMYMLRPVFEEIRPGMPSVTALLEGMDYARFINGGVTQIAPGLINVSGSTTLSDWRQGSDNTKIAGGAIAANTIAANKLTIGSRGISIQGIDFSYNRNTNTLDWTAGLIFYVNDAGSPVYANIPAGSSGALFGSGGIRYIYWAKGANTLAHDVDNWPTLVGGDFIILATWTGGTAFVATYGGTIVDGDRITTGSIDANRIKANTILAETVQIGGRGSVGSAFDSATWSNVSGPGKPVDYAGRVLDGNRSAIDAPSVYYAKGAGEYQEFKNPGWASSGDHGYAHLLTTVQYGTATDASGGPVKQILTGSDGVVQMRTSASTSSWNAWVKDFSGYNKPVIGTDLNDSTGTTLPERAILNNEDGVIRAPGGGYFKTTNSLESGSLKIRLPAGFTDTMILMFVDIYEYIGGYSCTMMISGYTASGGSTWYHCTAKVMGGSNVEYPVYFGRDSNGYATVYIGDASDTWTYPQVRVRDVLVGYVNTTRAVWENGWQISFTTSGPAFVTQQVLDTLPGADYTKGKNNPTSLYAINSAESNKLTGIQAGATVGAPSGTYVGPTLAQTVEYWSYLGQQDPAGRVNSGTTTISGGKITTDSIDASKIIAGSIGAREIAAYSVSAEKLNVTTLSAITANIGLLRTATSGQRSELDNSGLRAYHPNGNLAVRVGVW